MVSCLHLGDFLEQSWCDDIRSRVLTKVRMMAIFTSTARLLLRTEESMGLPVP